MVQKGARLRVAKRGQVYRGDSYDPCHTQTPVAACVSDSPARRSDHSCATRSVDRLPGWSPGAPEQRRGRDYGDDRVAVSCDAAFERGEWVGACDRSPNQEQRRRQASAGRSTSAKDSAPTISASATKVTTRASAPAGCPSRLPRPTCRVSTSANGQCQRYVE